MVKRRSLVLKEKNLSEEREMEEKIQKLLSLQTAVGSLNEEVENLKKEFRVYVERNSVGVTAKGYKFWEGEIVGVELQDNPQHVTDVNGLVAKIGLEKAVKYLSINRTALTGDIKAKVLTILTFEELKQITSTTYGQKKVVPYYGRKNIKKIILKDKGGF